MCAQSLFPLAMLLPHQVLPSASVHQLQELARNDACLTVEKAQQPAAAVVAHQPVIVEASLCLFQWFWLRTKLVVRCSHLQDF